MAAAYRLPLPTLDEFFRGLGRDQHCVFFTLAQGPRGDALVRRAVADDTGDATATEPEGTTTDAPFPSI